MRMGLEGKTAMAGKRARRPHGVEGGAVMESIKSIRPYEDGDAANGLRIAYLKGVILDNGEFVSEGKTFWIREEASDARSVSREFLFVDAAEG